MERERERETWRERAREIEKGRDLSQESVAVPRGMREVDVVDKKLPPP